MLPSPGGAIPSILPAFVGRRPDATGDGVEIATSEILTGARAGVAHLRAGTATRFDSLGARIDRLNLGMRPDRRNAAGMGVTMRAAAGASVSPLTEPDGYAAAQKGGTS